MRAYLIVRPEPAAVLDAALASEADAVVLDLAATDAAALPSFFEANDDRGKHPISSKKLRPADARAISLIARIGDVDGPAIEPQLSAAMALRPDAIMMPVAHGRDVAHLGARLAVHEAEGDHPDAATRIIALVASAASALNAATIVGASPRLAGLGWEASAVAAELPAECLNETGNWTPPLAQVRNLVRLTAAAAGLEAIEAAYPESGDGLARHLAAARRDGFGAALTTSPAQVPLIRGR